MKPTPSTKLTQEQFNQLTRRQRHSLILRLSIAAIDKERHELTDLECKGTANMTEEELYTRYGEIFQQYWG